MKRLTFLLLLSFFNSAAFSQNIIKNDSIYIYSAITIQGKTLKKGITVNVDLGEDESNQSIAKLWSEEMSKLKSYVSVLNHFSERGWELVQTIQSSYSYQGTGGTYALEFIMRRKTLKKVSN